MNAFSEQQIDVSQACRSIGALLIDSGRLSLDNAERVLQLQRAKNLRFGDAAIELGLLTESDIQKVLARQFAYPYLMPGDDSVSEEAITAFKPFCPVAEQLRILRSQLALRWFEGDGNAHALAVVSPGRGEGRSFIAANLAVVFSQLGERTLLIDADLRHPRQHEIFRLPNKKGMSSILAGRATLDESICRISGLGELSVLAAGAIPPNPQELLARTTFSELLALARAHFDVVLVDTPAAAESADAQAVAARTRAALIVARKDISHAAQLGSMLASLQNSGAGVVGAVLNKG